MVFLFAVLASIIEIVVTVEEMDMCGCDNRICCYGGNCDSYSGDLQECMCWINTQAGDYNVTNLSFYFLLEAEWVPGFCRWCANSYSHEIFEDSEKKKKNSFDKNVSPLQDAQKCSCSSSAECTCNFPVYLDHCWCPGGCDSGYFQGYQECKNQCNYYFKDENMTDPGDYISWMAQTSYSPGYCECGGPCDPCKVSSMDDCVHGVW